MVHGYRTYDDFKAAMLQLVEASEDEDQHYAIWAALDPILTTLPADKFKSMLQKIEKAHSRGDLVRELVAFFNGPEAKASYEKYKAEFHEERDIGKETYERMVNSPDPEVRANIPKYLTTRMNDLDKFYGGKSLLGLITDPQDMEAVIEFHDELLARRAEDPTFNDFLFLDFCKKAEGVIRGCLFGKK
jgi:hypothetical protein